MAMRGKQEMFTGARGLITETTATNFPADACTDLLNVDLGKDGSITTRFGLTDEKGGVITQSMRDQYNFVTSTPPFSQATDQVRQNYTWSNAGGVQGISIEVVRVGLQLFLFMHGDTISLTPLRVVDIEKEGTLLLRPTSALTTMMEFSSGNGRLYVASPDLEPFYVEIDAEFDEITVEKIDLQIRDLDGIDEGTESQSRPVTLTNEHDYNLRNQGWPYLNNVTAVQDREGGSTAQVKPINYTKQILNVYPSNSDLYYLCKAQSAEIPQAINAFSPYVLGDLQLGNTPAPKGHYIVDAFNIDRDLAGIEETFQRPRATAFYSGRAWWSGVQDNKLSSTVFFSQAGRDEKLAGRCYQVADPTSEEINDLVATDGGVITVQEMSAVIAMRTIGQFLVLFADNGVWSISGTDGSNFSAVDASVSKVSENGAISASSIIEHDGGLYYFGKSAIYRVVPDSDVAIQLTEQNLTEGTIKSFYLGIGGNALTTAKGVSSTRDGKIYWNFLEAGQEDRYNLNRQLILDTNTGAWTVYQYGYDPDIRVMGMVDTAELFLSTINDALVYDSNDDVVTESDDNTQVTVEGGSEISETEGAGSKIVSIVNVDGATGILYGELTSQTFTDWSTRSNLPYEHYFEMGFNAMGGNATKGSPVYVNSFFARDLGLTSDEETPVIPDLPERESVRLFNTYWQVLEKL
ncbi:head-closure protein [Vibrio phage 1.209.O._10N.222.52.B2]|nr:head-closure protein [Vibrio phage 1.209.O._10N.222.52.B2]